MAILVKEIIYLLLLLSIRYDHIGVCGLTPFSQQKAIALRQSHVLLDKVAPRFHGNDITILYGQRGKRRRKEIKEEKSIETPPRIDTPYGPIRMMRPLRICQDCHGRGIVRCNVCEGRGLTRATGHRKRNPINVDRMVGSRWTAVEIREGWRHYICAETKGTRKKENFEVRMTNSCGPEEHRVHLWIPEAEIRDKNVWRAGWLTLDEIRLADSGPLLDAKICFRCKGGKILPCIQCEGRGKVGFNQPLFN